MRVAILSHGHPALSPGGGERAAYSLFEYLKRREDVEKCIFFARAKTSDIGPHARFGTYHGRRDEILVSTPVFDVFSLLSGDYKKLADITDRMLAYAEPDVVHLHHFQYWGIDIIERLHRKGVRVVLSLHEFLAICCRNGQMLRTNGHLCKEAFASDCANCFPNISAGQFYIREKIIKSYLAYVEHFIAPSNFLAQRYIDWGLDHSKIKVIENPLSPSNVDTASAIIRRKNMKESQKTMGGRIHIGYFGQINPYKGVDVLLRAIAILTQTERDRLFIGIHGANLELQDAQFQKSIHELLLSQSACVSLLGSYDNGRVLEMMEHYDWIIVPSIWWENSPVVIQEALAVGKPLICGNIGGMAEKGQWNRRTIFFEPSNIVGLASILSGLEKPVASAEKWAAPNYSRCVDEIVSTYKSGG